MIQAQPFFARILRRDDRTNRRLRGERQDSPKGDYLLREGQRRPTSSFSSASGRVVISIHGVTARNRSLRKQLDARRDDWLVLAGAAVPRAIRCHMAAEETRALRFDGTVLAREVREGPVHLGYELLKRVSTTRWLERLESSRIQLMDLYGPQAPTRSLSDVEKTARCDGPAAPSRVEASPAGARQTSVTLELRRGARRAGYRSECLPGQFNMLYAFGVGEIPISDEWGPPATGTRWSTRQRVQSVGFPRRSASCEPGEMLGVRGPVRQLPGRIEAMRGKDVVIVAGGIGLAPLRPAIFHVRACA